VEGRWSGIYDDAGTVLLFRQFTPSTLLHASLLSIADGRDPPLTIADSIARFLDAFDMEAIRYCHFSHSASSSFPSSSLPTFIQAASVLRVTEQLSVLRPLSLSLTLT